MTALVNYTYQRVSTKVAHFNFDSTLGPATLNHIGLGYSMFRNPFGTVAKDKGWTDKLGMKGVQFDLFPTVNFATDNYAAYGQSAASDSYFNTFTALDTLTLIRGTHTLKFGAEMQYHQDNFRPGDNGAGNYTFRRNGTADPTRLNNTGDAFASFLLGEVDTGSAFFLATQPSGRYTNWGFFVDDTWKATSKLTINLGLRWEIIVPHADRAGRLSYVDINQPNAAAGNLPGVGIRRRSGLWQPAAEHHVGESRSTIGICLQGQRPICRPRRRRRLLFGFHRSGTSESRSSEYRLLDDSEFCDRRQRHYSGIQLGQRIPTELLAPTRFQPVPGERPECDGRAAR
jgi:hypothetical protein